MSAYVANAYIINNARVVSASLGGDKKKKLIATDFDLILMSNDLQTISYIKRMQHFQS